MSETQGCKKCNKKNPGSYQYLAVIGGFYLLFASVYGTIELIKNLIDFFK